MLFYCCYLSVEGVQVWQGTSGHSLSAPRPARNLSEVPWPSRYVRRVLFYRCHHDTSSPHWMSNFCCSIGNLADPANTTQELLKTKNNGIHTNTLLTFPPFSSEVLLRKKVFHYINLSNSENIQQEARWLCSRLPVFCFPQWGEKLFTPPL